MTQYELVLRWITENGFIVPAKMSGEIFCGVMFGSETSKRCRELRKKGILKSEQDGRFEKFTFADRRSLPQARKLEPQRLL